jgi:hypothetical protein
MCFGLLWQVHATTELSGNVDNLKHMTPWACTCAHAHVARVQAKLWPVEAALSVMTAALSPVEWTDMRQQSQFRFNPHPPQSLHDPEPHLAVKALTPAAEQPSVSAASTLATHDMPLHWKPTQSALVDGGITTSSSSSGLALPVSHNRQCGSVRNSGMLLTT